MHKIAIPQSVVDRVIARRGREHIHDDLDPARTALVVVDMQNAFMLPGVAHSLCLEAQEIVPNINRLAQAVRETGGAVVWIQTAYHRRDPEELVGLLRHQQARAERQARRGARAPAARATNCGRRSTRGRTTSTSRRSASPPSSRARRTSPRCCARKGIDTILVTGTVTNVCCESTARDAMMCNFKTVMVTDGNAAVTDEDHNASLAAFYLTFGDVMSTDMLIGCLRNNAKKGLAAAE